MKFYLMIVRKEQALSLLTRFNWIANPDYCWEKGIEGIVEVKVRKTGEMFETHIETIAKLMQFITVIKQRELDHF